MLDNPKGKLKIETPALLIDLDRLEENIKKMADFFKHKKARLRPHFKTHKSSHISLMQIVAGAKGMTCAKVDEAQVLVEAGIKDVLIANQIVETCKIQRLANLAKIAKITLCVDNSHTVSELSRVAEESGCTIYVLIELEVGMKRCGVETKEQAFELAKQIVNAKGLVFEGFQAYAGHLCHKTDFEERKKGVLEAEDMVYSCKTFLEEKGISVNEVSGSGTGIYNIQGNEDVWTEIQAGSYVFMDTEYCAVNLGFEPSLTILTTVIHKRNGYVVTDAGLKVCCQEKGKPAIKGYPDLVVSSLSEEHGKIIDEGGLLHFLQKLEYIPSHCCSTVNLHDDYYCVRGESLETVWPVSGRGKSR